MNYENDNYGSLMIYQFYLKVIYLVTVRFYLVVANGHDRLKSTNMLERLNQKIRRREKVIRTFPNIPSANRLIGALLMDKNEEWAHSSRTYIKLDHI